MLENMSPIRLTSVDQILKADLDDFLQRNFPQPKSDFLRDFGDWWHRGAENRWVVLADDDIGAYYGFIPVQCLVKGGVLPAVWWVDLVVDPYFRGKGVQTTIDKELRATDRIMIGFPNELAASIHRKHGWGVREDLRVLMLPLKPLEVSNIRRTRGIKGFALKGGALILSPLMCVLRRWYGYYQPRSSHNFEPTNGDVIVDVFQKYHQTMGVTILRDADYIQWRYLDSPYRSQLAFYMHSRDGIPTHILILRHLASDGSVITRILDIFGDFNDLEGVRDLVRLAIKDAVILGSTQVTIMATLPELHSCLQSVGFIIKNPARFCWYTSSPEIMQSFSGPFHWNLADSDNDAPI
jgi:hypothetical protein